MTEYLTEQEQIELLKNWIKQYSLVIIAGVALAAVAIFGWRTWQERQIRILSHASAVYDEMLTARAQNNEPAVKIQAQKLFDHYASTVYGQFAAMMLARDALIKKDYVEAEKQLRWALSHSHAASNKQIVRIRLARVLLAQHKPDDAVALLAKINDANFDGLTYEVLGDAYYAMHKNAEARDAYKQALTALPNAEIIRPLLQIKYDNLATASSS